MVAPSDVLAEAKSYDNAGKLAENREAVPAELAAGAWWWDAE
jgi:hypothetical protein